MNIQIVAALLAISLLADRPVFTGIANAAENPVAIKTELEGDWRPISIRNGDDELPAEKLSGFKFAFRGNRHTLTTTTESVSETKAGLRVDAAKSPKEIDLDLDAKPANERQPRVLGIYKLDGDTLTIAYSRKNPNERLKEFPAKPEAGIEVVTLMRIKSADDSKTSGLEAAGAGR